MASPSFLLPYGISSHSPEFSALPPCRNSSLIFPGCRLETTSSFSLHGKILQGKFRKHYVDEPLERRLRKGLGHTRRQRKFPATPTTQTTMELPGAAAADSYHPREAISSSELIAPVDDNPVIQEDHRGEREDIYHMYSKSEIAAAEEQLKRINKPAIRSIQMPDGDIIDCVLREKQPALDHPLLKNHTIQEFPSSIPGAGNTGNNTSNHKFQPWHQNDSCPAGTVPIRRVSLSNLLRERFGHKYGPRKLDMQAIK